MNEYQLKFTEESESEEESRQRTLEELNSFIALMEGRPLAIVTLDKEQSMLWDQDDEIDYQDEFGRQIIEQISDNITETLVIRNIHGLPVALAALNKAGSWDGLGVDERLRFQIATSLQNDETEFM